MEQELGLVKKMRPGQGRRRFVPNTIFADKRGGCSETLPCSIAGSQKIRGGRGMNAGIDVYGLD